jgi:UDP-N-acetylglucosamine 1-carboxyvinyltransferase
MQKLVIQGKNKLFGDVKISGAKNASLPILAATLMISDEVYLHNCPSLSDTAAAIRILRHLGSRVTTQNQTICVNSKDATAQEIPDTLMHEMRSSIIFLGAMLTCFNCAQLSLPGGCELGPRPIDLHLDALSQMGVKTIKDGGTLRFSAPNGLNGAKIQLSIPSVGATENIILGLEGKLDLKAASEKIRRICDTYGFEIDPNQKIYDMSVSQSRPSKS